DPSALHIATDAGARVLAQVLRRHLCLERDEAVARDSQFREQPSGLADSGGQLRLPQQEEAVGEGALRDRLLRVAAGILVVASREVREDDDVPEGFGAHGFGGRDSQKRPKSVCRSSWRGKAATHSGG